MHEGFYGWWKSRHGHGGCGEGGRAEHGRHEHRGEHRGFRFEAGGGGGGDFGGGEFGVRRPLRFLAHKLDLDEVQVAELATILNELKTERAQAAVDDRRTVAAFADAIGGDTYDEKKATDAAASRVKSAERLRDAVGAALKKIHALLGPDQRQRLAYLIRTGVVSI